MKHYLNTSRLSNYQLFQLAGSKRLLATIRDAAIKEIQSRHWDVDEMRRLEERQMELFPNASHEGLSVVQKWAIVLFPFFTTLQSIFAGQMLASQQVRKWKEYWRYLCLGYLVWIIAVMALAAFQNNR